MDIIQEVVEKITKNLIKNKNDLYNEHNDISIFIKNIKADLDKIGQMIVKDALEETNKLIKNSKERKKDWYVERKRDSKKLLTIFGEVDYSRTYYKHKRDNRYKYLSDEFLGIKSNERMDLYLSSELIKSSAELSYKKSSLSVNKALNLSSQTVMNQIRKVGKIENYRRNNEIAKKEVKILYIEADEDHISLQNGKNKDMKLVYVHEGKDKVSKNRYKLKNVRYFSGQYEKSEELWLEVSEYLEDVYDMEKVEKVYLSGDGARWIKEGLNWIEKSIYVLDYFHLSKYVKKATAQLEHARSPLWMYINNLNKKNVKDLFNVILEETENEFKKKEVKASRRYIINNWEGIKNRKNKDYVGCSAEGHVSHILSSRLSSRPLGWSERGSDEMARLRVFKANGGNIFDEIRFKREQKTKTENTIKLDKRIVNKKLKGLEKHTCSSVNYDNISVISKGKTTWISEYLKSARGII